MGKNMTVFEYKMKDLDSMVPDEEMYGIDLVIRIYPMEQNKVKGIILTWLRIISSPTLSSKGNKCTGLRFQANPWLVEYKLREHGI